VYYCIRTIVQLWEVYLLLNINPTLPTPIYAQILEQVRLMLASGLLRAGERLPSVRELALQLRVNPNTVAKAYRELEREGTVRTERGRGVYAVEPRSKLSSKEKERIIAERLDQVLADGYHLGMDGNRIQSILDKRISEFAKRRQK